ncbi:universal stress protein [Marinobacter sp. SS8-8]|uniref:universal stress protein n=1 Tax=Marinobacter sp. SS8-8 TaxID=3050452 RepID=UPI0026DFF37C|nr:universal stress protein [Marinobacter sp. SS8-8]|tara:strand:- start:17957 stop:18922 length:966 start_codon:yes stop_codon:yes gene_type:complete
MFQRIVVPLDGSCLAEWALPHAINLAKALDIKLVLIRVLRQENDSHHHYPADPVAWDALQAEAAAYLDSVASRLGALGLQLETATLEGEPVDQIISFARKDGQTLLVMTSHGFGGISHCMLGSVAHKSILQAHVSFLLVRALSDQCNPLQESHYNRMTVPLDGSSRSECVLPLVEMLSRHNESTVDLVSFVPSLGHHYQIARDDPRLDTVRELESEFRARIEENLTHIADRLKNEGLHVQSKVEVRDSPISALWEMTRKGQSDLVVMAAHGNTCVSHWPLGALPLNALVYGETPLLVLQDLEPDAIELTFTEKSAREAWGH